MIENIIQIPFIVLFFLLMIGIGIIIFLFELLFTKFGKLKIKIFKKETSKPKAPCDEISHMNNYIKLIVNIKKEVADALEELSSKQGTSMTNIINKARSPE